MLCFSREANNFWVEKNNYLTENKIKKKLHNEHVYAYAQIYKGTSSRGMDPVLST